MRVILINAKEQTVKELYIDDNLASLKKAVDCRTIAAPFVLDNGDTVYCDDEGMYNPRDFVELSAYPEPIAGNLLIVGHDGEGGNNNALSTVEDINQDVSFIDFATLKLRYRLNNG